MYRSPIERRLLSKANLSPEEQEVVDEFTRQWTEITEPLGDDIETAVRRGEIDLETLESIRADIEPRVGDYADDIELVFRETSHEGARAGRALSARRHDLDIDWDIVPERTIEQLDDWAVTTSESVSDTLSEDITRYLRGAHEEGLGVDDIAEQFQEEFVDGRLEDWKADQLARDVTTGPSNAGSHSAHEDAEGVVAEEWLTELDDRERESHAEANGQIVAVGETFDVGGHEAEYPGDASLPIEEATQCRCVAAPVFADELSEDDLETLEDGGTIWRAAPTPMTRDTHSADAQPTDKNTHEVSS